MGGVLGTLGELLGALGLSWATFKRMLGALGRIWALMHASELDFEAVLVPPGWVSGTSANNFRDDLRR